MSDTCLLCWSLQWLLCFHSAPQWPCITRYPHSSFLTEGFDPWGPCGPQSSLPPCGSRAVQPVPAELRDGWKATPGPQLQTRLLCRLRFPAPRAQLQRLSSHWILCPSPTFCFESLTYRPGRPRPHHPCHLNARL